VKSEARSRLWSPSRSAFAGFRFPAEVVVAAVRWYLRYGLSYRDVEELLAERGIEVDHVTVYQWVQRFTPLLADAARFTRHGAVERFRVGLVEHRDGVALRSAVHEDDRSEPVAAVRACGEPEPAAAGMHRTVFSTVGAPAWWGFVDDDQPVSTQPFGGVVHAGYGRHPHVSRFAAMSTTRSAAPETAWS
jgi:hypothetical protein